MNLHLLSLLGRRLLVALLIVSFMLFFVTRILPGDAGSPGGVARGNASQ